MSAPTSTSPPTSTVTGCGSSACQCASPSSQSLAAAPDAFINGIALHAPGKRPDTGALREMAYSELLRQHAVMNGLLPRLDFFKFIDGREIYRAEGFQFGFGVVQLLTQGIQIQITGTFVISKSFGEIDLVRF